MEKLRFVFVSSLESGPWGGSEELWSQTSHVLANRDHSVGASVRYWPMMREPLNRLEAAGVAVHQRRISPWDILDFGVSRLKRQPGQRPAGLRDLSRWMRARHPDLVCFSSGSFGANPFMMKLCRDAGLPYVSLGQANSVSFWPRREHWDQWRLGLAGARGVFFVSKQNLELAELQVGQRLPQAEIVWNPFNVPYTAAPPWPPGGDGHVWHFASVARLDVESKGHDLVLSALSQEKWRSRPWHLTLYGNGPDEASLKAVVEMLGLSGRVTFAGYVQDVEALWARHHALILGSRYEGLPLALIEAMLCSRVPIVTCVGGNPDVVLDQETGFLAPAPTVQYLDLALERAWARRDEWQAIGRRAGVRIREMVPRDPAAMFADRLEHVARSAG